jgi:hypothetical protein
MRQAMRVAASLLLACGLGTATTNFSSTGAVDLMAREAAIAPTAISDDILQTEQDPAGDAELLLFIFAESGPDLPGGSFEAEAVASSDYAADSDADDVSEPIAVAEGAEFVTYFLHRES